MKSKVGFTLIELLLVMGIASVIFTVSGLSWSRLQKVSQLDQVAGEIKIAIYQAQAQSKGNQPTGVYFENNYYVIFKGDHYLPNQSGSITTNFPSQISLTQINLPDKQITFDHKTGNILNYQDGENLYLTDDQSGQYRKLNLNPVGLITISQ